MKFSSHKYDTYSNNKTSAVVTQRFKARIAPNTSKYCSTNKYMVSTLYFLWNIIVISSNFYSKIRTSTS